MVIRNIWAVGRNYSEHAKELGNSVPTEPMIFLKAGSSIAAENEPILIPSFTQDIHHEVEIAFQFNEQLRLSKMGLAIDFTAREVQNKLKKNGHPWTLAKSFKHSCAISKLIEIPSHLDFQNIPFELKVNGEIRQKGCSADMVFGIQKLAEYVKERFPICPGDLLLTGTPSGVAQVRPGDILEAEIPGKIKALWSIKKA